MVSQYFLQAKPAYGANIGHPSNSTSYHSEEYFSSAEHDVDEVGGQVQELSISGEILTPDTSSGPSSDNGSSDSSSEFVTLGLDEIHVEDSYWTRAALDPFTVERYRDAILQGDKFPPIVVSEIKDKWVVLDGVHRLRAYQGIQKADSEKVVGIGTRDPVTQSDDYRIQCKVATVPVDEKPIIFSCNLNRKNGKALSREDYKKVAEQLYRDNYGAPINKLAAQIHLDPKTFNKYVVHLVSQYKEEREAKRQQLQEKKLSDRGIGKELKKEYPTGKGVSSSSVNLAKKIKVQKVVPAEAPQAGNGSIEPDVEIVNPAPIVINAKTGPCKNSKNSGEIEMVCGDREPFSSLMIRHMEFLRTELRDELVTNVRSLVDRIRSKELLLREKEGERTAKRVFAKKTNLAAA